MSQAHNRITAYHWYLGSAFWREHIIHSDCPESSRTRDPARVIDAPSRASASARPSRPASARPAKPNCLLRHLLLAALHPDRFPETSNACSTTPIVGAAAGEKTRLRHQTTWRRNLSDEEQHDDDGQGSDHRGEGFGGHCARSRWLDNSSAALPFLRAVRNVPGQGRNQHRANACMAASRVAS